MNVAVIGSRNAPADAKERIKAALPAETTCIISGGARGIDTAAAAAARELGLPLTEYLPDYNRYGRGAPLRRNDIIIDNADLVLAFWDGTSRGTGYVITQCRKRGRAVKIIPLKGE